MRKERLRQRKRDKEAAMARYCSMSPIDSISMLLDSTEEEGLDSNECESSSSTLKSVVKVARPSPAPWDTDVDSPPRKHSKKDSTWGERGRSGEMDRQGCYMKDRSDSGLRDERHRDQDDGNQSAADMGHVGSHSSSRCRATAEQKHPAGAALCDDRSTTNVGSVGASSTRSRSTTKGIHSDDGVSSSQKEVAESLLSSPAGPVLCLVGSCYRGQDFECWVL